MDVDRIKNSCSETLVVGLLREREMHGYEMCREIERQTGGYFQLKHGTIYPLLHRLQKRGLVESSWRSLDTGKPRKVYRLTAQGQTYYTQAAASWRELFATLTLLVPEVAG